MSQTVYNYDPRTRIYTGASQADESPLEPGVFLIPAHATSQPPPGWIKAEGAAIPHDAYAALMAGKLERFTSAGEWECIDDVRGVWYDTDGQPVKVSDLDADVSQLTREAPPDVPEGKLLSRNVVAALWELIDDVRGTWYDADGRAVQIDDLNADVGALTREAPPDATYKLVNGKWEQCPDKVAAADAATRAELCARIDVAVAAIYARFGRFEAEYTLREQQAKAYKAADYKGDVPVQVAAFATPAGKTPREAADIIIAQSEQLRGVLSQLGVLRMRKYEVMQAADVAKAQSVADEVLAAIAAIGQAL